MKILTKKVFWLCNQNLQLIVYSLIFGGNFDVKIDKQVGGGSAQVPSARYQYLYINYGRQ